MGWGAVHGKAIKDAKTDVDWLATDPEVVAEYQRDFAVRAEVHRWRVSRPHEPRLRCDASALARKVPNSLPLLLIAGECDPVGECGAGVRRAAEMYRKAGVESVTEKSIPACATRY